MRNKFDLCYLMAKEGIALEMFTALCEVEARHKVDLGHAYRNAPSAKLFTHYIAEAQRQHFLSDLSHRKFYSFLMDGSTDAGKIEQELVVLLSCVIDDITREMKSHARFFCVAPVQTADANGLVKCLSQCLSPLGVTDILDQKQVLQVEGKPVLIGGGTDGANVNIGELNGMTGVIQNANPWLMWSWCFAHRLELACKNALTSSPFKSIEELLLRLYYLYENHLKKFENWKTL